MIAAGEVVERPQSVVKELMENAIDAKAKRITIELLDSGIKEIKISDDGIGMSHEDALMCFSRHATSKIKNEYDLFRIETLGFRGEAIPSIASVSKFKLETSNGIESTRVIYQAGKKVLEEPCAMNRGTVISVTNLFYNVPARLKYLKTLPQELSSISFLVSKYILANPQISFTLINNKKVIYKTSGNSDLVQIFGELYGLEVARSLMTDFFEGDGYKAKVTLCKGIVSRANKLEITTIINGRYVKSNLLNNAIIESYKTYIPEGRFPIALINFEMDPLLLDVNVHPTKMMVKISGEKEISDILRSVCRGLLEKNNHIPSAMPQAETYIKEDIFEFTKKMEEIPLEDKDIPFKEEFHNLEKNEDNTYTLKEEKTYNLNEELKDYNLEPVEVKEVKEKDPLKLPTLLYIGQVHGTYLVFQTEDGMYLMDQHAAAERINYEYYYDILKNPLKGRTELLVPIDIEVKEEEAIFIQTHEKDFKDLGLVLSQISQRSFLIREIPLWLHIDDATDLVFSLLNNCKKENELNIMKYRDELSKQIACKASIKANHAIRKEEVDYFIEGLKKCKNPYTCPHGRPTIIKFSIKDLEKMFKRVI
jgi:DNA mismatch repair protein MutL